MHGRIIETEQDILDGADWLARAEPRFAHALELTGPWPLRRRDDGFAALRDAIIGQQVSVAAAKAIRAKVLDAGFAAPEVIAGADPEALRACGLSRQKVKYLQALAGSGVDFEGLRALPDEAVIEALLPIPGIGRWTVEMYLIFALGRADVFAVDDLALAEGARMLFDLPERPKRKEFNVLSASWSPWRAVAARGLWAYYAYRKQREGVAP
ncbi:DNA-3-methyladenine glycosylase family protein [Pseudothioclava arenosa]|uniref:DNA-3-methyladenine glycosylase II n=1 Tax=Pseudothioclava arenosa TaxID=1795308 RepID=A0A2A4CSJ4_9RHOB|nr:DNA-3-methyladenine glycosylase [Pseudothioclava arenosa]PCD77310.1 3-methyladenine DNA glycosylase [Pseudothioclava arenosa]